MRQEVDAARTRVRTERAQLLFDLRDVAVTADAVGLHALVDLAEHHLRLRFAAGTRDPALRIDDEVGDQPGARDRGEREQRRRRVAARRPDNRGRRSAEACELVTMQLRQSVDGVRKQARLGVVKAVPARIVSWIAQPEVRPEVDDRCASLHEIRRHRRRGAVGQGQEHRVRFGHLGIDDEAGAREMGVSATDRIRLSATRHEPDDLDERVPPKEPDQLCADITRGTNNRDAHAPSSFGPRRRGGGVDSSVHGRMTIRD